MSSIERATTGSAGGETRPGANRTEARDRQLHVLIDRNDGRARAVVSGEIDHDSAPMLLSTFTESLRVPVEHLEVDLTHVAFCDCAGLNALLRTRSDAEARGVVMTLVRPSAMVWRILELTGTGSLFGLTGPQSSPDPALTDPQF